MTLFLPEGFVLLSCLLEAPYVAPKTMAKAMAMETMQSFQIALRRRCFRSVLRRDGQPRERETTEGRMAHWSRSNHIVSKV